LICTAITGFPSAWASRAIFIWWLKKFIISSCKRQTMRQMRQFLMFVDKWDDLLSVLFIWLPSLKNRAYNQHCFEYNVQVSNFCIQTTRKMYKYAALDAVGTAGKCQDIHDSRGFGSLRLNIGDTKQFYHTFYFNYIKDINFHNFSIVKVTKPDFPRLLRSWKTLWPISKTRTNPEESGKSVAIIN
jgi:hypothetical protein